MATQLSTTIRGHMMDQFITDIGAGAKIRIYNGSLPASCSASIGAATLLAELTGGTPFATQTGGVLTLSAITQDSSADATGTAQFARIWDSAGTTCHWQGAVTATGGGGDMELSTVSIVAAAAVSITSWTLTAPGA